MTGWDSAYLGTPPWDIGGPQPAIVRLADAGAFESPVLDAGCGTGENALELARRGFDVVGVDFTATAIGRARAKAVDRALSVEFVVHDALHLARLGRRFRTVVDCGLFHTFDDAGRDRYVEGLSTVTVPGSRIYLMCFSDLEPWGGGPRRVSKAEIRASFADGWDVVSIEPVRFVTRFGEDGARAWLATIRREGPSAGNVQLDP